MFCLDLNEALSGSSATSIVAPLWSINGSSLSYCYKLPEAFELFSVYSVKLYIGISTSMSLS